MHPAVRVQLFPFSPILLTTRNDVSPSRHQADNVYFLLQKIQSKSCIELVALLICFSDYTNIFELFFDLNQDYGCISDWKVSYPAQSDSFLPLLFWGPIRLSLSGEAGADNFLKALPYPRSPTFHHCSHFQLHLLGLETTSAHLQWVWWT